MFCLQAFTRKPAYHYSSPVAGSVHFRFSKDGVNYSSLNQNYGMLFPKAGLSQNDTIDVAYLKNVKCYVKGSLYGIAGEYAFSTTDEVVENKVYFWTTKDFIYFDEVGLTDLNLKTDGSTEKLFEKSPKKNEILYYSQINRKAVEDEDTWIQVENNTFVLPDEMGKKIIDTWTPLNAEKVYISQKTSDSINTPDDLKNYSAKVEYSDGSLHEKKVDWFIPEDELNSDGTFKKGLHDISGEIRKDNLPYPLTRGYADPVLFKWENNWYYLATNDNLDDIGMFVRRASTVENLFNGKYTERCILSYNLEKGFVQTFWAPEFHVIGGELYILFAVGGEQWAPQSHMMKLKKGGDILNPRSWEEPIRVKKPDGSNITDDGITLDMTHFVASGKDYLVWSYRYGIGTPMDTGSMLYIATTNPEKPWQLTSEPQLLSRPLYGWENTEGTINNEGPYALLTEDKVYLAFSGGAAGGYTYAVGYLIGSKESNLLNPANWLKTPCPVLSSYSVGIDGPGHNSFFVDDEGKTMVAYHGQLGIRCSAIHRVHFNKAGFPLLNMAPERDIPEWMREVSIQFTV